MEKEIKRRKFGKTGLEVTELSFGAMNLRRLDTFKEAYEILNYVLDSGINLIDTARAYNGENGEGKLLESEVLVGNAIRNRTDLEEPIIVITKHHGYTVEEMEEELKTSLGKLGIDGKGDLKIGDNDIKLVYLFHGINEDRWATMQESGVLEKAKELKKEGRINYIGFSSHYAQKKEIIEAIDSGIFDVCELPYNIFNRELGEDGETDILKHAHDNGLGIINMKAFNGNGMVPIYESLKEVVSIDYPVMLNFCLTNPYISTVDAGARYIEEFKLDIDTALGERMSSEEITEYKEEADKVADDMKGICRECMHCLEKFECPEGIDFPGILATYSRYEVSRKLNKETAEYLEQYQEFELTAEECIECGKCMPWCEYELNIPEMLKEAREALG
ncbi:MAG: aldo/keto reductase [Halanaerobiaceae bacterium]